MSDVEPEPQLGGTPALPEPAPVDDAGDGDASGEVVRLGYEGAQRADELGGPSAPLADGGDEREQADRVADDGIGGVEEQAVGVVHGSERYGAGEKIASVVRIVMERPPPGDARARAAWRALGIVRRLGILDAFVALFPPIDDHNAWDERIGLFVGVALNLASDGVELDLDACRYNGAALLRSLVE